MFNGLFGKKSAKQQPVQKPPVLPPNNAVPEAPAEEEESGGGQNGATKVAKLQDYPKNDVDSLAKIEDTRAQSDEEDYNFLQSRVGGVGTNSL